MEQTTLIKGTGGLVILGGTGAGGYLVYESNFYQTIEKALTDRGLTILNSNDNSDDTKWQELAKVYIGDNDANKEDGFIGEKIENGKESTSKDKFKEPCKRVLSRRFLGVKDESFKNASRWCVEEKTIEAVLEKVQRQILENGKNDAGWGTVVEKAKNDKRKKTENEDYTNTTLKSDCCSKKTIKTTNKDYWSERRFVIRYCTKPKTEAKSKVR